MKFTQVVMIAALSLTGLQAFAVGNADCNKRKPDTLTSNDNNAVKVANMIFKDGKASSAKPGVRPSTATN